MPNVLRQIAGTFGMKVEHFQAALHAVQTRAISNLAMDCKTIIEVFETWGWQVEVDGQGNIVSLQFNGVPGDLMILFRAIAPFVEPGSFIQLMGEKGEMFEWRFDGRIVEAGQLRRSEYKRRVMAWLQQYMINEDPKIGQGDKRIHIQKVYLEPGEGEENIAILFQETKRPDCLFGRRMPAIDPIEPYLLQASDETWAEVEEPESWAIVILSQLQERIEAADLRSSYCM